jgi:DNA-binding GntR family transcriptional regulator
MSPNKSSSPNQLLRETVYANLKKQILSGQVSPGARLVEAALAAELEASRTVIREAIKQLELEGLVRITPYKGTKVARFSPEDLEEIYTIQAALEGVAAGLATRRIHNGEIKDLRRIQIKLRAAIRAEPAVWQRLNVSFHQFFLDKSGNRRLQNLIKSHRDHFARYWRILLSIPGQRERNTRDHEKILKALKNGDPLKVRLAMEDHIQEAAKNLAAFLQKHSFLI